jgi:DNA-binding XRE family transcriptional regulator
MKSKKQVLFPKHQRIMEQVCENIKLARKRRKLTTIQMADRADINRATLFQVEKANPGVSIGISRHEQTLMEGAFRC